MCENKMNSFLKADKTCDIQYDDYRVRNKLPASSCCLPAFNLIAILYEHQFIVFRIKQIVYNLGKTWMKDFHN